MFRVFAARLTAVVFAAFALSHGTLAQQQIPSTVQPGQIERQFEQKPQLRPETAQIQPRGPLGTAVPEGAEAIKFVINAIQIEGATTFPESDLIALFPHQFGSEIALADVYKFANAISVKYRNAGYILSQAIVPEQEIENGGVRLVIIEGYVDAVELRGDVAGRRTLLRDYAEQIKAARPLTAAALERYLLLINDLPGVQVSSTLVPSQTNQGAATLVVDISRRKVYGGIAFSNRGSRFLGPGQGDVYISLNSLLGLEEQTSARYVSTGPNDELHLLQASYRQVFGNEGTAVTVDATAVESEPGTSAPLDRLATSSLSGSVVVSHPFIRSRARNLSATLGFVAFDSETDPDFGPAFKTEDRIREVSAGVSFDLVDRFLGVNLVDATLTQGIDAFGASEANDLDTSRPGAPASFTTIGVYAARLQSIAPRWSALIALDGQYAFSNLLSPREFAYGGEAFGRGFDAAEILGDSGVSGKLEIRYSATAPIQWFVSYTLYGFIDAGKVWRRSALNEKDSESGLSGGFGARSNFATGFSGYLEVAVPINRDVSAEGDADPRLFGGLAWSF